MGLIAIFNNYTDDTVADGGDIEDDLGKIRAEVDGAIDAANLANDAVVTAKLADDAVTLQKIADLAVGTAKLAANAVTAAKLAANSVTNAAIAVGTINADRLTTDSLTLGDGTDGTKLGPIQAQYAQLIIDQPANSTYNIQHDLGTTDIIGVFPVRIDPTTPPVESGHGAGFYPHSMNVVDANNLEIDFPSDGTANSTTVLLVILYF